MWITTGGVALIAFMRAFFPNYALPVFEATILIALAYHLYDYERGRDQAALDFSITVTRAGIYRLDRFVPLRSAQPSPGRMVADAYDDVTLAFGFRRILHRSCLRQA